MNGNLQVLQYCQSMSVRTIILDGEPWWVLTDVCKAIGIDTSKLKQIADRLDEDEKGRYKIPTPGGVQESWIVNEFGLYSVILRSNKPEAKAFKRWITHEVLPSIRRTGSYSAGPRLNDENGVSKNYTIGGPHLRKTALQFMLTLQQLEMGGEVQITNLKLMELMNFGAEQTLRTARNELLQAGYIEYTPGVKGKPGTYKLHKIKPLLKALP